jgi:hypothetical protein
VYIIFFRNCQLSSLGKRYCFFYLEGAATQRSSNNAHKLKSFQPVGSFGWWLICSESKGTGRLSPTILYQSTML